MVMADKGYPKTISPESPIFLDLTASEEVIDLTLDDDDDEDDVILSE